MAEGTAFTREMGITHKEFLRLVGKALQGEDYTTKGDDVSGRTVVSQSADRRIEITLAPQSERRIALLSFPVTMVTVRFFGYRQEDAESRMARFDRAYHRGGG
ncbi:MAG: hypothetical protein OQJ99_10380 [Rhodospirillales bacterium]|nr:hypothetical protein [Rhodospirillales bacterium]MCW8953267.1 hypothetical protein [Rhodospirillales bacterium]MCW8971382.1 hypothetical protein [Rhodospirillales bacterium]